VKLLEDGHIVIQIGRRLIILGRTTRRPFQIKNEIQLEIAHVLFIDLSRDVPMRTWSRRT